MHNTFAAVGAQGAVVTSREQIHMMYNDRTSLLALTHWGASYQSPWPSSSAPRAPATPAMAHLCKQERVMFPTGGQSMEHSCAMASVPCQSRFSFLDSVAPALLPLCRRDHCSKFNTCFTHSTGSHSDPMQVYHSGKDSAKTWSPVHNHAHAPCRPLAYLQCTSSASWKRCRLAGTDPRPKGSNPNDLHDVSATFRTPSSTRGALHCRTLSS